MNATTTMTRSSLLLGLLVFGSAVHAAPATDTCRSTRDCSGGQVCIYDSERSAKTCRVPSPVDDYDGDGHDAIEHGGDDCDDADATRFPGNPEYCDADGHDEDCNLDTFGDRDLDGDGQISSQCFNLGPPAG